MKNCTASYVNLLKTAIGSGIISYPFLFKTYGYALAITIIFISGLFAFLGLVLYAQCNYHYLLKHRQVTLSALACETFPRIKVLVDVAVCFKCAGVAISYLIIIRTLLPNIIHNIFGNGYLLNNKILLFLYMLLLSPLSFFEKIGKLKYTSFFGLSCIFIVICLSFYNAHSMPEFKTEDLVPMTIPSIIWLSGVGKVVFSFTCHQNIFTVQSESTERAPEIYPVIRLCFVVVLTAFVTYITFGFVNFLVFGKSVTEDVLSSFPNTTLTFFIQGLYVIVLGMSYPLQIHPTRLYFIDFLGLNQIQEDTMIAQTNDIQVTVQNVNHPIPNKKKSVKKYMLVRYIVTILLLIFSYLVAVSGVKLGSVYGIIGSTASTSVCSILPGLLYLKAPIENKPLLWRFLAILSVVFGCVVFLTTFSYFFTIGS